MRMICNLKYLSFFAILSLFMLISCGDGKDKTASITATYDVTALTNHEYTFNGGGLEKAVNPDLTLKRGATYVFKIDALGHPFLIKTVKAVGKENLFETGVTGMASDFGTVSFSVPKDAPATLYYACQYHKMMTGKLIIVD